MEKGSLSVLSLNIRGPKGNPGQGRGRKELSAQVSLTAILAAQHGGYKYTYGLRDPYSCEFKSQLLAM